MTIDADIKGPGVPLIRVHVDGEGTTQEAADMLRRAFTARSPAWSNGRPMCVSCGWPLKDYQRYCQKCGQRINWDWRTDDLHHD